MIPLGALGALGMSSMCIGTPSAYPYAFDRLLLLNQVYAVGGRMKSLVQTVLPLVRGVQVNFDWGQAEGQCESIGRFTLGGYCNFLVKHVLAMDDFARVVYGEAQRASLAEWPDVQAVVRPKHKPVAAQTAQQYKRGFLKGRYGLPNN